MQQRWSAAVIVASTMLATVTSVQVRAAGQPLPRPDTPTPAASTYAPVRPCRVLDTRDGTRAAARAELRLDLTPCGPPEGTQAVVLTVTAVDPAAPGYATVYPAGAPRPTASLVNWAGPGATIANTGIIATGDDAVSVYVHTATHLVVDVSGYFVAEPAGVATAGRFVPLALPTRILDTRLTERPQPRSITRVAVPPFDVPADAEAVLVNVTATESSAPSYVTAWAAGERPLASVLNVDAPGQTRAATTLVGLSDGAFQLYSHAGEQLVVDLIGYVTGASAAPTSDGLFVPLVPERRLDTRADGVPLYAGGSVEVGDVTGAVLVGNVTLTEAALPGYLRVLPARVGSSPASSVNVDRRGATAANLVGAPVSDAGVAVWSKHQADAVLDQTGYFTGTRPAATEPVALNLPPHEASHPTEHCAGLDPRLSYERQPGAPRPREVRRIGTSRQGRPIWAEYYGSYSPSAVVLVVAAVHGDECGPALVIDAARRQAGTSSVGYWLIPVLNPDGLAAFNRYTATGADLNRDGYRVAEPESQALLAFTADIRPNLTVHVHSPYGFVGGYGPDPVAHEMAAAIAWLTGMTRANTAGTKPGDEFLWQGQMLVHPHRALLVELFPVLPYEATVDRPRLAPVSVSEVAEDARQVIAVVDQYMGGG